MKILVTQNAAFVSTKGGITNVKSVLSNHSSSKALMIEILLLTLHGLSIIDNFALLGEAVFVGNSIIGTPTVLCEENDVSLDIVTSKPFSGNIFVKGRSRETSCRQSYTEQEWRRANNATRLYTLPLGECGMQKLRSVNPRGINFAVIIIVSFHPDGFITKNDRAFHIQCFYMESDEIVTSSLEISALPPQELSDAMLMPSCTYSVHSGAVDGPLIGYANVGEAIFHVWQCKGSEMGMLVKKCFVTDGDGEDHVVIDHNGCSSDLSLLSEVTYEPTAMRAYAHSQAFRYADSNQLYFTCQIKMCQRQMKMCEGITPPRCDRPKSFTKRSRRRRSEPPVTQRHSIGPEVDVAAPELFVLDRVQWQVMSNDKTRDSPNSHLFVSLEAQLCKKCEQSCQPTESLSIRSPHFTLTNTNGLTMFTAFLTSSLCVVVLVAVFVLFCFGEKRFCRLSIGKTVF